MAFLEARASARLFRPTRRQLDAGLRDTPERIVLDVSPDTRPSGKPPVRIFLGTQPEQHRAERVFVWSIMQVRDPSRVYEIHLMKSLRGFDQRGWATGFTNYRFAIPHFAGAKGKAIYNDVDQIYLRDPAELFDLDMGDHGFLAISPKDSSVMLIDCARMASVWTLAAAQRESKGSLLALALARPGRCGALGPEWNARDEDEFDPAEAKCVHFTTLHTQPWRPTPRRFVYLPHPIGYIWHDLEHAADQVGYEVFTVQQPSSLYRAAIAAFREGKRARASLRPDEGEIAELRQLVESTAARTVLHYSIGGVPADRFVPESAELVVTRHDPATAETAFPSGAFDGVVCSVGLEDLFTDDVPWLVDQLFAHARNFVCARVDLTRLAARLRRQLEWRDASWWRARFEAAGARHPGVQWRLVYRAPRFLGEERAVLDGAGALHKGSTVWVLTDDHAGDAAQAIGLAEELGLPFAEKQLCFNRLSALHNRLLGATRASLDSDRSAALEPPWPDLVVAAGRRTAPVARWIGQQSRGRTRLVQVGRKGGDMIDLFDVVVTPRYARLWPHPQRIETLGPLNPVTAGRLEQASKRWPALLDGRRHPRIVLCLDDAGKRYRLNTELAHRLGSEATAFAARAGGSLTIVVNAGIRPAILSALRDSAAAVATVPSWEPNLGNPYLGYLAAAEVLIVAGESASMLTAASATEKPLYIYPLPQRARNLSAWVGDWVLATALSRPENRRGTTRPQQGLEYLCAKLLASGIVRPPRDIDALHRELIARGRAQSFGAPPAEAKPCALHEAQAVAERLRSMLLISRHA